MSRFEGLDWSAFEEVAQHQDSRPVTAVTGETELPLDEIIEDPDQPRRSFDEERLQELAASIKKSGVVQPIVVRPKNDEGKYIIVMGARRYRASRLAGRDTIKAIVRVEPTDGYDQMVENIQREDLSHEDIARFIKGELDKGAKPAAIATGLGKPRSWVSLYTGFYEMHDAIRERVEDFGIRAAYELQKAMELDENATLAFLSSKDGITQRDAIAFAKELKTPRGKQDQVPTTPENFREGEGAGVSTVLENAQDVQQLDTAGEASSEKPNASRGRGSAAVAIIVQVKDRLGRLLHDRVAEQGANYGVIAFDNGNTIEEVVLSKVKLIEIMKLE